MFKLSRKVRAPDHVTGAHFREADFREADRMAGCGRASGSVRAVVNADVDGEQLAAA